MSVALWIASKLRLRGSKSGANATGITIAVVGIALAVMVMELTMAIVVGFQHTLTSRIMGFDGHLVVLPAIDTATQTSDRLVSLDPELQSAISAQLPGAQAVVRIDNPGLLKSDNDYAGLVFRGYSADQSYDFARSFIVDGSLPELSAADNANKIAISAAIAKKLSLKVGDKAYGNFFINDGVKTRRFEIAAIYDTGFSEYDKAIAYAPLRTMQKVMGADSISGTSIAIALPSADNIKGDAAELQKSLSAAFQGGSLSKHYPVDNVKHIAANYFSWLELLNTNVVVIFILMTAISGFTLISSMFILILDRISTIGILRALGATKRQIRYIFVNMAMRTVALGIIIGNALGLSLLLAQSHWALVKLDPEVYFLPYVPVEINWWWILALNIGVAAVAWLLLAVPSRVAANISPASTMKYE